MWEDSFLFPVNVGGKLKYLYAIFPAKDIRYPRRTIFVVFTCLGAGYSDSIFNKAKAFKVVYTYFSTVEFNL